MFFKKPKPIRDKEFLIWVCSLSCLKCKNEPAGNAHHRLRDTGEKCGSKKSGDDKAVPLCYLCHDKVHKNERKFFAEIGYNDMPEYSRTLYKYYLTYEKKQS